MEATPSQPVNGQRALERGARRIAVLVTLDTKAEEATFLVECIRQRGHRPWLVDLSIADGYKGGCPYQGWEGVPMVPLFIGGAGPADVHHVAIPDNDTRLYLLEGQAGRTIAIEVNDWSGGTSMDELDAVVRGFEFGTR